MMASDERKFVTTLMSNSSVALARANMVSFHHFYFASINCQPHRFDEGERSQVR